MILPIKKILSPKSQVHDEAYIALLHAFNLEVRHVVPKSSEK